jgi:hypothetical protein
MIESSRIRRAEHMAHLVYDRQMKKFVRKTKREEKIT